MLAKVSVQRIETKVPSPMSHRELGGCPQAVLYRRILGTPPVGTVYSDELLVLETYSAKWTVAGWCLGLAHYNWFASVPEHVPIWAHVLLTSIGAPAASVVIGGGMETLVALATRSTTSDAEDSHDRFAWTAFMSPVLAFFAAKYMLLLAA